MADFTFTGKNQDRFADNDRPVDENRFASRTLEAALNPLSTLAEAGDIDTASCHRVMQAISEAIAKMYQERLGKRPAAVTCDLLRSRVIIWVEGSLPQAEQLLFERGGDTAQSLCFAVDRLVQQQVLAIIERSLQTKVTTLIADTCYESNCTGIIAQL